MTKLLVVIGSARPNRVANKVLEYVQAEVAKRDDVETTVADLKEIDLPFFDSEIIPASEDYAPTGEKAVAWAKLVADADHVLFITPEYNHTLSAIQKNAIDWLFKEWENKPVTTTAYGWAGGARAIVTFDDVMDNVKADVRTHAKLAFMKELNPDGSLLNENEASDKINAQLDVLFS
jgi:NAD(P)H-dependent FMN reductase